jgi:hypothetical protein
MKESARAAANAVHDRRLISEPGNLNATVTPQGGQGLGKSGVQTLLDSPSSWSGDSLVGVEMR